MKHQTITLVKFKALSKRLGLPLCWTVGLLESLWLFACHNARDGQLNRFTALELAGWLEYPGDEAELINALVETRWVDRLEDGSLEIHSWNEHKPNWLKGIESQPKKKQPSSTPSAKPGPEPSSEPSVEPGPEPPNLTKPNPTKRNPPPPTPATIDSGSYEPDPGELSGPWLEVAAEMGKLGMAMPERACQYAAARGCPAFDAMAAVEHFKAHPGAWGIGLLYKIIEHLRPDQRVSWPEPSEQYARDDAKKKKAAASRSSLEKAKASDAERLRNGAEAQRLERDHGGKIDAMPREKMVALIAEVFPKNPQFQISRLPDDGRPMGMLRDALLEHLESVAKRPTSVLEAPIA